MARLNCNRAALLVVIGALRWRTALCEACPPFRGFRFVTPIGVEPDEILHAVVHLSAVRDREQLMSFQERLLGPRVPELCEARRDRLARDTRKEMKL